MCVVEHVRSLHSVSCAFVCTRAQEDIDEVMDAEQLMAGGMAIELPDGGILEVVEHDGDSDSECGHICTRGRACTGTCG